jgi:5-formyltetrahydrofolate cyclo-ligase
MGELTDNSKSRLRRELEDRRAAITRADVRGAARQVRDNLVAAVPIHPGLHVVLYAACRHEIPLRDLEEAAHRKGARTYYPRVEEAGLSFRCARGRHLTPGRFGIPEPDVSAVPLHPSGTDIVVLVPGIAFDRQGGRLGRGLGYYDRALSAMPFARRIGVTLEAFVVQRVPVDTWDVPMHAIVTERRYFVVEGAAGGDSPWI